MRFEIRIRDSIAEVGIYLHMRLSEQRDVLKLLCALEYRGLSEVASEAMPSSPMWLSAKRKGSRGFIMAEVRHV